MKIDLTLSMSGFNLEQLTTTNSFHNLFNKEIITILYIGESFQDVFLRPVLEEIRVLNPSIPIHVFTVNAKSSEGMFHEDTFVQKKINNVNDIHTKYFSTSDNPRREFDLNSKEKLNETLEGLFDIEVPSKFDLIFCCFELHFCINWRFSLVRLLRLLNRDGIFLFSEINGTLFLLDGNIPPVSDNQYKHDSIEFENFLAEFEKERSKFHYWKPEISFTNYKEVVFFLKHFFDSKIDLYTSKDKSPQVLIDKLSFMDIVEGRKLEYFSIGLDESSHKEKNNLVSLVEEKWEIAPQSLTRDLHFFIAHGFNPEALEKPDYINWNYSTFSKDIQEINDFKIDDLTRKALDVLISHDVMFPEGTFCLSLISWIGDDYSWRYPMSIIKNDHLLSIENPFNEIEIEKRFQRLLTLERHYGESIIDFLYKGRKQKKFTIVFQLHKNDSENYMFKEECIFRHEKNRKIWIGFYIKRNRKGQLQKLIIGCSQKLISDYIISGIKFKYSFQNVEDKYYEERRLTKTLSKITFKEDFKNFIKEEFKDEKKVFVDFKDDEDEDIKILLNNFNEFLKQIEPSLKDNFVTNELLILVYKSFLEPFVDKENPESNVINHQVSIFPAGLSDTRNDKNIKGLGLFLYEKNPPVNDDALRRQIFSRDKVLNRVSNLILQRTASINYINQDFKEKSRTAAIAAISARNFSHNLGSHVIPKIFSSKNLKIEHIKGFLEYIQQRNDFINQLTSFGGGWTMSTWFVKDLMSKFYQQYYLLDYLANYEGISAYSYDGYEDKDVTYKEIELSGELAKIQTDQANHLILFGYFSSPDKNKFLLSKKDLNDYPNSKIYVQCEFDWLRIYNNGLQKKEIIHELLEFDKIDSPESIDELKLDESISEILVNQSGRPFKVYGQLKQQSGANPNIFFIHGFIEDRLIIKVRKRSFVELKYFHDNVNLIQKEFSSYLNNRVTKCHNLSKFKETGISIFERIKDKLGDRVIFFGVISKLEIKNSSIFLNCELKDRFQGGVDTEYESVIQIVVPSLSDILKNEKIKPLLVLGKRIIVEGIFKEIAETVLSPTIKIRNTKQPFYIDDAQIKEIIKIDYLITPTSQNSEHENPIIENDLRIAIPGGIAGYQSFYTIIENIVRNAAKHDWVERAPSERLGRSLEVKIEVEDQNDPDHYICKIWTNTSNLNANKREGYKLNEELNDFLIEDIIEEDGSFRQKNLGVSEIKINASFLYTKSGLITDKSKIKGEEIILKEKVENFEGIEKGDKIIKGFLRASRIMEFENGKIHERLGYRFKIQKPKELLIISEERRFEEFAKENNFSVKELQATIISNKEALDLEEKGNIDYEFCVVIQETLRVNEDIMNLCLSGLLSLFFSLLFKKYKVGVEAQDDDDLSEIFDKIFDKLEKYPYRFFWIVKGNDEGGEDEMPSDFIQLILRIRKEIPSEFKARLKSKILFIKRRIVILKENNLELLFKISNSNVSSISSGSIFKLLLYDKWIRVFERAYHRNKTFVLNINLEPSHAETPLTVIPTLPISLRKTKGYNDKGEPISLEGDFYENETRRILNINRDSKFFSEGYFERFIELKKLTNDTNSLTTFIFGKEHKLSKNKYKKENVLALLYQRHKSQNKSTSARNAAESIYSEELSGEKLSFSQFFVLLNFRENSNNYFYYKFMFQLFENAYPNILILDERIIEYQKELKKDVRKFFNSNLIIPYQLTISGLGNYKVEGHKYDNSKQNDKIGLLEEFDLSISKFRIKYQYIFSEYIGKKNPYRVKKGFGIPQINTIIIHQSLLERVLKLTGNASDKNQIKKIIQEIKFKIPSLIITSGKGKTESFSEYAKYLPFSTLKGLIMSKSPDKILLSQVLFKTLK